MVIILNNAVGICYFLISTHDFSRGGIIIYTKPTVLTVFALNSRNKPLKRLKLFLKLFSHD